ncbi:RNA-directed DNA polymerase, eukaryota [Tanacetum coccineum]
MDVYIASYVEKEHNEQERINNYNGSKDEMSGSVCSGIFKKPVAPQSGGSILCVLEELVEILMVAVYAPHDLRDKKILWDYLEYIINRWDGADMFNTFIANAGLEEIPLGGSSFTWCHKSATKMSKLDRFLISENLFNSYPDICATSLDRFLSDHRPILLRESNHDYGPIPFRRMEVIKSIQYLDKIHVMDLAQKAKVKWAIEGDENSRYFHGVLNKKRNLKKPSAIEFLLYEVFPKGLFLSDQQTGLEGAVLKRKKEGGVDCGSEKSPGPVGVFVWLLFENFGHVIEK